MARWRDLPSVAMWLLAAVIILTAWQLPLEGTCCGNTPRQCEAASVCYDDGFCLDAINMCNVKDGNCSWIGCSRIE